MNGDVKEDQKQKLKTYEMSVLRKMCGMARRDRRRNVDILKELQMVKDINEILQTCCLTYFGHVTRMEKDRYPNILMHGYTHGRRPRGRPRKRWLDNITEDCEDLNLTIFQASRLANDRVKWRNTVHNKGSLSVGTSSSSQRL